MKTEPVVFVVDDDAAIRHSLEMLLTSVGIHVRTFPDAVSFLDALIPEACGCVVADLRMPGMNGLDLQTTLHERGSLLPVIFLTGHGDVPAAVTALKHGASDFLEKPFDPQVLIARVRQAVSDDLEHREALARAAEIETRMSALTPREHEIMRLVADGRSSKVIGIELEISERTVELHRSRMMRKMGARSVVDLVRLLTDVGR